MIIYANLQLNLSISLLKRRFLKLLLFASEETGILHGSTSFKQF